MTLLFDKHQTIASPALAPAYLRDADAFDSRQNADAVVTIGLINNMPDPALQATERQFTRLLTGLRPTDRAFVTRHTAFLRRLSDGLRPLRHRQAAEARR